MSWLSKATGIHWGNIGAPVGMVLGSLIGQPTAGAALGSTIGKLGNMVGGGKPGGAGTSGIPTDPGMSAGVPPKSGSVVGNVFQNPDGSIDWSKLADIGLTGVDAYNAAMNAQKQGSLLNTGVSNYNNNWTQGKNILMKAHPVDLSADFAGSDNPFARTSAGAQPWSPPPPMPPTAAPPGLAATPQGAGPTVPPSLFEQIFKKAPLTGSKIIGSVPQPVKNSSPTPV